MTWFDLQASDDDRTRLEEIQRQLSKAWATRDFATIDRLLAADSSVTHIDGAILSREEVLGNFESGDNQLFESDIDDLRVRVYDGFAIVTGRNHARGSDCGWWDEGLPHASKPHGSFEPAMFGGQSHTKRARAPDCQAPRPIRADGAGSKSQVFLIHVVFAARIFVNFFFRLSNDPRPQVLERHGVELGVLDQGGS